ncbi:glycoside hydrolase family 5 protein [Actomonas aquatica]|uniref:Glycoside hydrolase family 5 protein n=1 Tax=Actomonas aquatica TaxID=2866162 RepID=A0ABZ1C2D6_9BACT|nr:glycoside hydrolase family 5 protein [Opitutus sp. WL0086]WRQ85844.1 glycoside hydrolase family 5 protein [Opitutus sp. WL0086]
MFPRLRLPDLPALLLLTSLAAPTSPAIAADPTAPNVAHHGRLQVDGNRIVGASTGEPVSLAGLSLFWSQWEGEFYNPETVAWLKQDWHVTVIRSALGIAHDGYLENPAPELAKIKTVIDAALAQDLYVIIDWHDHKAEEHTAAAVAFFTDMARTYGDHPNIIYEIYNEPLRVSWSKVVKPYAEEVIAAIRAHDPDNLIIVGTPYWSQRVDEATADPIDDPNLAYTLHFYAGTHKAELRKRAQTALDRGFALFVSEWGTVDANGDGEVDRKSVAAWMAFIRTHQLSHLNWSVANKDEGSAILRPEVDTLSGWTEADLTPSGQFIRYLVRGW